MKQPQRHFDLEVSEFYRDAKRLKLNLDFMSNIEGSYNTEYPNLPVFHSPPLLKAAIFCCFDVFPVRPHQTFQVQTKTLTIQHVFPDYFYVFYDYTKAVAQICSVKKVFLEIPKIHRKTPVPESLF